MASRWCCLSGVRRVAYPNPNIVEVEWHPERSEVRADLSPLEGCYAAVHLAGANLAGHRWTPAYKRLIVSSRVDTSRALGRIFTALTAPPPVVVAASAIGYYGDRGNEVLTEASRPGTGFLAGGLPGMGGSSPPRWRRASCSCASAWFSPRAAARCPALLRVFRFGLGGRLGNGRQWMSWVSLEDAVAAMEFAIAQPQLSGAFNTTSPHPVTNAEFTYTLGRILRRPTLFSRTVAGAARGSRRNGAGGAARQHPRHSGATARSRLPLQSRPLLEQALTEMV